MTIEANLVSQGGLFSTEAKAIGGNTLVTGMVGAGTTQATATVLPLADYICFATVAAGSGAILTAGGASEINVYNGGANSLAVYPPVGGNMDQGTVNASFAVAAGKNCLFQTPDSINWFATHST
jgi:hypothetical protein